MIKLTLLIIALIFGLIEIIGAIRKKDYNYIVLRIIKFILITYVFSIILEKNNKMTRLETTLNKWQSPEFKPEEDGSYIVIAQHYKNKNNIEELVIGYHGEWKINYEFNILCWKAQSE